MTRTLGGLRLLVALVAVIAAHFSQVARAQDQVRGQFLELAPHLSMDTEWVWEEITAPVIVEKLARLHDLASIPLDAHPLLRSVGGPYVRYLAGFEARVMPGWRAEEWDVESAMLEAFSRIAESAAARAWQREFEQKSRRAYSRLLPVARLIAGPATDQTNTTSVVFSTRQIWIKNESSSSMHNATLSVLLRDIYGNSSEHIFFVPEFRTDKDFPVRLADDWLPRAERTTFVSVEVLCDEMRVEPREVALPSHLRREADRVLADARGFVGYDPTETRWRLRAILPQVRGIDGYPETIGALSEQADDAMPAFELRRKRLLGMEKEIESIAARRQTVLASIRTAPTEPKRNSLRSSAERMALRIQTLEQKMVTLKETKLVIREATASVDPSVAAYKEISLYKTTDTREKRIERLETFLQTYGDTEIAEQVRWELKLLGGGL